MSFAWTQLSGYTFGSFRERHTVSLPLPVSDDTGYSYSVISGQLPGGLRIDGNNIVGTPYEVPRNTDYSFCIRASNGTRLSDRTFALTVTSTNGPTFITNAGELPVGPSSQLFTLDSTYVDFQLEVNDENISPGQHLSYFIARDDGELPPGLVLTDDGRVVGFVQPALAIKPEDGNGTYDDSYFDAVAYDFAFRPTNGYDSYIFDSVYFDFNITSQTPKKLNRDYQFTVTVTDGDVSAKRTFSIFVVGDDYFRADNTYLTGLFTADVTYLRKPIWLTSKFLGTYRANNYVTIPLQTYDTENIINNLEGVNTEVQALTRKVLLTDNVAGGTSLTINAEVGIPAFAQYLTFDGLVVGATGKIYQISNVASLGNDIYRLTLTSELEVTLTDDINFFIGSLSVLPPGTEFDVATSEVYGTVPYQPAITTTYNFTIKSTRLSTKGETTSSSRTFTLNVIGEIDSVITWNTNPNLGSVNANFVSTLSLSASSTVTNAIVLYNITSGRLPPGLTLDLDGEIVGKVNQYYKPETNSLGLTTFDYDTSVTTFDGDTTTVDRVYTFIVEARDQFGISATSRTFTITVNTPNQIVYSNIRVKPFLKLDQRASWKDFINNTNIFWPNNIYRTNDANFGLQTDLSMIIYAGIETTEAAAYVGAMGLNHKRKRFHFGSVKKATAYITGTTTPVYEVVYLEMVDPLEPNKKRLPNKLTNLGKDPHTISVDSSTSFWSNDISSLSEPGPDAKRPDPIVTVDSQGYFVSNPNPNTYFPSSVSIWQERLSDVGETERNYLPLWMRSIQSGSKSELGFQLAVPLCYCKVGAADDIILNIKHSGFDFKTLDYTVDRYIIDSVTGSTADKYLVFRNDRITV